MSQHNSREHASVYVLATASNLFLSIPEYLAVRTAVLSYLPLEGSTAGFISSYGIRLGLTFELALVLSGFMRYWLGERFFLTLSWVSLLQNAGVDSSGVYSELFWYGLGATICYVAMILVLRRSHNKLVTMKTGLLG